MFLRSSRRKNHYPLTRYFKTILVWLLTLVYCQIIFAQTKSIKGRVLDSATREPLQNVSITVTKRTQGALTNTEGKFSIVLEKTVRLLNFSSTGYRSSVIPLSDEPNQEITVLLAKSYTELEDVFVNAKRGKYSNKNNHAVDLIRQVISHKAANSPDAF